MAKTQDEKTRRSAELAMEKARQSPDSLVSVRDLRQLSPAAASRTLARLAERGQLVRVAKGLYFAPKETSLGESRPSRQAILRRKLEGRYRLTKTSAANLLGLTTQIPAKPQLVVFADNLPTDTAGTRISLRRTSRFHPLSEMAGAMLEVLRDGGAYADTPEEVASRLTRAMAEMPPAELNRLVRAGLEEPPRVRAALGALMETAHVPARLWRSLRETLNPLSRFDFGALAELPNAREWQAK